MASAIRGWVGGLRRSDRFEISTNMHSNSHVRLEFSRHSCKSAPRMHCINRIDRSMETPTTSKSARRRTRVVTRLLQTATSRLVRSGRPDSPDVPITRPARASRTMDTSNPVRVRRGRVFGARNGVRSAIQRPCRSFLPHMGRHAAEGLPLPNHRARPKPTSLRRPRPWRHSKERVRACAKSDARLFSISIFLD